MSDIGRGLTKPVFMVPAEDVIYEEDGVRVCVALKAQVPGTDEIVDLEPGERVVVHMPTAEGTVTHVLDFQRYFKGETVCPYGITDAALASILKYRFEQKLKNPDTPPIDWMVSRDWVDRLNCLIRDY